MVSFLTTILAIARSLARLGYVENVGRRLRRYRRHGLVRALLIDGVPFQGAIRCISHRSRLPTLFGEYPGHGNSTLRFGAKYRGLLARSLAIARQHIPYRSTRRRRCNTTVLRYTERLRPWACQKTEEVESTLCSCADKSVPSYQVNITTSLQSEVASALYNQSHHVTGSLGLSLLTKMSGLNDSGSPLSNVLEPLWIRRKLSCFPSVVSVRLG